MNRVRKFTIRLAVAGALTLTGAGAFWLKAGTPEPAAVPTSEPVIHAVGRVDVEAGISHLALTRPGRVIEVKAYDGQTVSAGTVLVRLDDATASARLAEAEAGLAEAECAIELAEQLSAQHEAQVTGQVAAVEAALSRLDIARLDGCTAARKFDAEAISADMLDNFTFQWIAAHAQWRAERSRLDALKAADPAPQVARAWTAAGVRNAQVDQAREEVSALVLRAPAAGTILRVLVHPGEAANGSPVVDFCPAGLRIVRVDLDPDVATQVKPGCAVHLIADDATGRTAMGHVRRLADWFAPRRQVLHDVLPFNDRPTLECVVDVDGDLPFRLHETVRVQIVAGRK